MQAKFGVRIHSVSVGCFNCFNYCPLLFFSFNWVSLGQSCMRREVAHSRRLLRGLLQKGHQSENEEENKGTPMGEENLGGGIHV